MPGTYEDPKKVSDALKLELKTVVSHPMGARSEFESSARAVSTLNY